MKGFGFLQDINTLVEAADKLTSEELVDMSPLTDDEEEEIDNIIVPELGDDRYVSSNKKSGSAGNVPDPSMDNQGDPQLGSACDDVDIDPQLDGLGGGSFKQGIAYESANDGAIVDEAPMKDAATRTSENVMERAKDIFKEMYGSSYEKRATQKDYDLDTTTPSVTTKEPINFFKVKKGW